MPRPGFCMRKGISLHRRQALFPLVSAFWAGARGGARVAGRAAPVQHRGVQAGGTLGCSAAEMRRRRAMLGRELERRGLCYALVYGASRSGSAVMWLTGWPVTREALLVVAPEPDDDV